MNRNLAEQIERSFMTARLFGIRVLRDLPRDSPWLQTYLPRGHHTPAEQYRPKSPVKANRRRRW